MTAARYKYPAGKPASFASERRFDVRLRYCRRCSSMTRRPIRRDMDHVECVVIGAGVVGLAVARSLARGGRETIVLEAADAAGTATSSRNSEVIHAGIYYPPGSLKSRLCVAGRNLLYEFCAAHGVEAHRCGKLIVA